MTDGILKFKLGKWLSQNLPFYDKVGKQFRSMEHQKILNSDKHIDSL